MSQEEDKRDHTVGYHHIYYGGVQMNNHGWGAHFRRGYHKTVKKKRLYELEFVTLKHPREVKQSSSELAGNFVFGKLNYAYNLRFGFGGHNVLAYKPFGGGVEIKTIYSLGVSAAFLKPIYYLMVYTDQSQPTEERFDPEVHELYNIAGTSSYFKGFNEMKVQPGIFGKFALNFEYAAERSSIRSLETGIVVDGYLKDVEILAYERNYPVYVSFYLALQYGQKWYR